MKFVLNSVKITENAFSEQAPVFVLIILYMVVYSKYACTQGTLVHVFIIHLLCKISFH